MFKNQLQELAQRSCFNLPSYSCIREGPDHAPRFKAAVTFNGETFESHHFFSTLRQAEHAAAEVALNVLSKRSPAQSLASRILDETAGRKNLLQETAQRVGAKLPNYITIKSGPGHHLLFTSTVEIAGLSFKGEPAKTKKQAEKNAAMAAWSALKQLGSQGASSSQSSDSEFNEEQEQSIVARALVQACRTKTPVATQGHQTAHSQNPLRTCLMPGQVSTGLPMTYSPGPGIFIQVGGDSNQGHRIASDQFYRGNVIVNGTPYHGVLSQVSQLPLSSVNNVPAPIPARELNNFARTISNCNWPVLPWPHTARPAFWGDVQRVTSLDAQDCYFPSHPVAFVQVPSLAPPVTTRPISTMRSAPPRIIELNDHANDESNEEAAARQFLGQLQL